MFLMRLLSRLMHPFACHTWYKCYLHQLGSSAWHPPILIDWAMQCHWQSKNTNKYCHCTISAVGPSIVCCLVTNEMATTRNGSDRLPKGALSDLTGDTWQSLPWNPTIMKARAMITPGTNQWCFSLNEQDDSKIKTKFTNVQLVSISKL
jgi:hypothetical protein